MSVFKLFAYLVFFVVAVALGYQVKVLSERVSYRNRALDFEMQVEAGIQEPDIKILPIKNIKIGATVIKAEIASSAKDRAQGLMYRKELSSDAGMLFIFDREDIYPFWMKNTYIPLDMIWISKDSIVVEIAENVKPCENTVICPSTKPSKKAKYVLEVNAGYTQKHSIKIGDYVRL